MPKEVVVALLGIIGSALAAWFAARASWRLEYQKWRRTRDDLHTADLRIGLNQLILAISSAAHSMCWLTWLAQADATKMTRARIDKYDEEMHKLLPQLLGLQALVASLRPHTYRRFNPLIEAIFDADRRIGDASLSFVEGEPRTVSSLASLHAASMDIEVRIPQTVRSVLAEITNVSESTLLA
jgi:hypothetical protein